MPHMIRGTEYLARFPDFDLKGRDRDIERISSILMRKKANSLLLVGPAGVGASALILGLQAMKNKPGTPFDIISKRLFFLDTDSLFSSGDGNLINEEFQKLLKQLHRTPESVLIIEDTLDFMEAARNSGNPHFINALNLAVKSDKTQVILEIREENLSAVLKWHSDMCEAYTLYDLKEPVGEFLFDIVQDVAKSLSKHHGVAVSEEAVREAIELTSKHRDIKELGGAQPQTTISLLDRALSTYRQNAHRKHPAIAKLEREIILTVPEDPREKGLQAELAELVSDWEVLQKKINETHRLQREGEEAIFALQDERDELKKERERRTAEGQKNATSAEAAVAVKSFSEMASSGGYESPAEQDLTKKIRAYEKVVADNSAEHDRLVAIANEGLALSSTDVTYEFSQISGIPADKLNEDATKILLNLENTLLENIYGQDAAVRHVADTVKVAQADPLDEPGPMANYMFLGPSGVGKTELSIQLAAALGLELIRFDMSEYMEKHAVARLIGAPPGYDGFDAGGILTNTIRKKPRAVYLFDETEKAHSEVFNIFLQILTAARLTDNLGRVCDFSQAYIIFTSNIGQTYYLDASLSEEEANEKATLELKATYRPELLNRFNGRKNILHFKRLGMDIIERIVKKSFSKLDAAYALQGIRIKADDTCISEFCKAHYNPEEGARGLPGYIKANLRPIIVNHRLSNPGCTGTFDVHYNTETDVFDVEFKGRE